MAVLSSPAVNQSAESLLCATDHSSLMQYSRHLISALKFSVIKTGLKHVLLVILQ